MESCPSLNTKKSHALCIEETFSGLSQRADWFCFPAGFAFQKAQRECFFLTRGGAAAR